MNPSKERLYRLIIDVANRFCNREKILLKHRVMAFQSRDFVSQLNDEDRSICLEIRNEVSRLVGEKIKETYEYDTETSREWKKDTFGNMPEMELGICIEEAFVQYSEKNRELLHTKEHMMRRK